MTDPTDDLVAALRTIRTCWPVMLTLTAQQGQRGGDPARPPIPAHILSVRRETAECLASWARLAIEERDLHPHLDAGDAHAVAGFLITHSEWLVGEAEDAVVQEVALQAARCLDITERNRVRKYRVGMCPEQTEDEDGQPLGPCPGTLYALMRQTDNMLPKYVVCDGPQLHTWDPWRWRDLGRRLGTTSQEIA